MDLAAGADPHVEARASARTQALARLYAPSRAIIVLVGATGTGKTHLAQQIHDMSGCAGPFVDRTAAEFTETLAADQLFGHERGAFTGAVGRSRGVLAEAAEGTLLLDDFHLASPAVQALLLRALSREVFRPLSSERDLQLRTRIIVGLRECPDALMRAGVLLPDLRYRLGYCVIRLQPLAERREEIQPLASEFLARCPDELQLPGPPRLAADVVTVLEAAPWPGNVRELKECVRAAYLHATGENELRFDHLPEHLQVVLRFEPHGDPQANARAIEWALWRARNRVGRAAELIGAHRNTVSAYLNEKNLHSGQRNTMQMRRLRARDRATASDATDEIASG